MQLETKPKKTYRYIEPHSNMKKTTSILLAIASHIICQYPNANAAEILFDSANVKLSEGILDGQGPWKKVSGWGSPYAKSIDSSSPVITSLPETSDKIVGARASLTKPASGEKPVVVSFTLLRAKGDFVQIGVGNGVPVTICFGGNEVGVRDKDFGATTPGFRADGQKLTTTYREWIDVRGVLDPKSNTVSIKVKKAGEPDSAFVELYTSDKHDKTGFPASVSTSLTGAESLIVRVPGNNSVPPNEPVSSIRNLVVSEE